MAWLTWIASNLLVASLVAAAAWWVERRLQWHAVARVLWVLVLVKLVTPPVVTARLVEFPSAMACTVGACGCPGHATDQTMFGTALRVGFGIWLAGAATTLAVAATRWLRLRRLLATGQPAPAEWQSLARRLGARLGLRRAPVVLAVPGRLPPLVVPGRRPRLVLPAGLIGALDPSQRSALVLHELAHIRRSDHLVRLLELAVGVVYWWLLPLRVLGRRLRSCEETCCDAAVVAHLPQARRDYARLLLDVVDFVDPLPRLAPQATGMSAAHDLEARLRAILGGAGNSRRPRVLGALVVALALAALPCGVGYGFASAGEDADAKPQAARVIVGQAVGAQPQAGWVAALMPERCEVPQDFSARALCEPSPPPRLIEMMKCPELPQAEKK
jgi:beta-lactamase regulating signal transducer with metallopeptidase domain